MKKLISLMLVLIFICSVLPMAVSAASWFDYAEIKPNTDSTTDAPYVGIKYDHTQEYLSQEAYDLLMKQYGEHLAHQEELRKAANHDPNKHTFNRYGFDTKYHWLECACGCKISMEPHMDPLDTTDDYCTCGYHFSDNADLVTLWLADCNGLKNFRKDVCEYETDAYTYKEVNKIKRIATRTFDSEATVELPEDLSLKDGENKIEIKVTAENKKVTKVYTVIVNK